MLEVLSEALGRFRAGMWSAVCFRRRFPAAVGRAGGGGCGVSVVGIQGGQRARPLERRRDPAGHGRECGVRSRTEERTGGWGGIPKEGLGCQPWTGSSWSSAWAPVTWATVAGS